MTASSDELTCRELVELVTDYFEGAMPAEERERFDAHVADCPGCERYLAQMRTTVAVVGATADLDARPEVSALIETFRGWKRSV